jgi:hypothetical protein
MGALAEFLFPAPARRGVGSIIGWWEGRRPAYNVVVGAAGVVSLGLSSLFAMLPGGPGLPPSFPWIGVVIFGALANVCYTRDALLTQRLLHRDGPLTHALTPPG